MNNNNREQLLREPEEQLLRKPQVQAMVGNMSNSTLYYLMNRKSFPLPVKIGARSVAWKKSEIIGWINSRERAMNNEGINDEYK